MKLNHNNDIRQGLFLTFEGIDGCGKSLQAKKLAETLSENGHEVEFVREPGGDEISEKIRDILLDAKHEKMSALAELFLYEAARAQLIDVLIGPALKEGKIVIADRFYDSTVTYQGFGRGLSLDMIHQANAWACSGFNPDRTYYLDITWEESLKRRLKLNGSEDRMENQSKAFFMKVREGYQHLAETDGRRILVVNGMDPVEIVSTVILNDVQLLLDC